VQELKDWRTFATSEARIPRRNGKQRQPLDPTLQAERIRELRQAWKDLGR
jgi:hypothetical protein